VVTTDDPLEQPRATLAACRIRNLPRRSSRNAKWVRTEEKLRRGLGQLVAACGLKVDVAGVRIGSLALYLPTLEMSDYDLRISGADRYAQPELGGGAAATTRTCDAPLP